MNSNKVNQRFLYLQIINIVGIVNFLIIVIMQDELIPLVTRFSLIFSGSLFLVSLCLIIFFYNSFLRKIETGFEKQSSSLSPVLKYVLPNFMIAGVLILFISGLVYDVGMFRIFFLFLIIIFFPLLIYFKSLFVAVRGNEVRFYNYSNDFIQINGNQIKSIGRVLIGFVYKIKYIDSDNLNKVKYFFPKGYFFGVLAEPKSVKLIKSLIAKSQ